MIDCCLICGTDSDSLVRATSEFANFYGLVIVSWLVCKSCSEMYKNGGVTTSSLVKLEKVE